MSSEKGDPPKPSGRVRHDSGGRAVWEWAVDSGKHAIDSTSRFLKRLDIPGLQLLDDKPQEKKTREKPQARPEQGGSNASGMTLMDDGEVPSISETKADPQAGSKRGFNPYDSRTVARKKPAPSKAKAPASPRITQPVRSVKKPGFFARLFGRK